MSSLNKWMKLLEKTKIASQMNQAVVLVIVNEVNEERKRMSEHMQLYKPHSLFQMKVGHELTWKKPSQLEEFWDDLEL